MAMTRSALYVIGLALSALGSIWTDNAFADRRVALIIGISAYQHSPALPNPENDARAIAAMFQKVGFTVVSARYNLANLEFKRAVREFEDTAADSDVAVIYFAGHGIEINGTNYLIPADATLASDRDAEDEAISLERLAKSVDAATRLRLVILDACRDNPFARTMKRQRAASLRETLIAYAAKAGSAAEDGAAEHSPFTQALINHLFVPGLDVRLAFGRVRDEVLKRTDRRQEPFVYGSLGGANVSLMPQANGRSDAVADLEGQRNDYTRVERIGTKAAWEVFLAQYPIGFYADLARQQVAKLSVANPTDAAPTTAPTTPQVPPVKTDENKSQPLDSSTEEQRAWQKIKDSTDPTDFQTFLRLYPSSTKAEIARSRLQALDKAARGLQERLQAQRRAKEAEEARFSSRHTTLKQLSASRERDNYRPVRPHQSSRTFAAPPPVGPSAAPSAELGAWFSPH
jgi:hypothetical protein